MRFSPFVERISGQGVAAWDIHHAAFEAQRAGEDVIILSIGDPDFPTPEFITDAAVEALRIQDSSATFFGNGSKPGGILTAPGNISQATADRVKDFWDTNFTGANSGKVAVLGDGMQYT